MKLDNVSLPHPVIGLVGDTSEGTSEADVMGLFEVSQDLEINSTINVAITYELLNCPQLLKLIEIGCAHYACEISCKKTACRSVYTSTSKNQVIELSADEFRDQIVFEYFIIGKKNFVYADEGGWHPDYEGQSFDIKAGMVLGYGGSLKQMIVRDPSASKMSSALISVLCNPSDSGPGPFEVDVTQDVITLFLPKKTYIEFDALYTMANVHFNNQFHAALVMPAIAHALTLMWQDEGGEYADRKWYQALDTKISKDPKLQKFGEKTPAIALMVAQALIKFPFSRLTEEIIETSKNSQDDDI